MKYNVRIKQDFERVVSKGVKCSSPIMDEALELWTDGSSLVFPLQDVDQSLCRCDMALGEREASINSILIPNNSFGEVIM